MNDQKKSSEADSENRSTGVEIRAGDRVYIPAGALQIWVKDDGTTGSAASLAVDPWLPDPSASGGTPTEVVETIIRQGFPVSSVCQKETIFACQESREVRDLIAHPEVRRLRYMAVIDGTNATGVLDLDRARGEVQHNDPKQNLLVKDVFEPLGPDNWLHGDSPLIDYLLTADVRPFRLVQLAGEKLGTIDVEDLQRLPVRVLLFTKFSHLETLLARQLCIRQPQLLDIVRTDEGLDMGSLGKMGSGPEREIERFKFGSLLRAAKREGFITIKSKEIRFLERYRNKVAHGPRWYITRRSDVGSLVNCVKRVSELIEEAAIDD